MERMCGFHSMDDYADKALLSPECLILPTDDHYSDQGLLLSGDHHRNISPFGSERESGSTANISESGSIAPEIHHHHHHHHHQRSSRRDIHGYDEETCKAIKTQIASHPLYPKLLDAYIDCQKVGAPPEITTLLEEIKQESSGLCRRDGTVATTCLGDDPELDEFMETYCDILVKYKLDLERPFDEATTFLNQIQIQLGNLGRDDSSEEEFEGGGGENTEEQEYRLRNEEDREIKERLLRKYGDRLSALKIEFSKKKKKGKLPKEARQALLQWWNAHYKWPYPTESDKIYLAETTGLDQKQINNWFINQRKRHWKPSDNMQFAVMGNCSGQFIADN